MLRIHLLSLMVFIFISLTKTETYQAYRSQCRRDVLFKGSNRDQILTGTPNNLISFFFSKSLSLCARECVKTPNCTSLNYKANWTSNQDKNCQILSITKNSSAAVFSGSSGWIHYEPVSQIGPRCRLITCSAGYRCVETCNVLSGFQCIDINECLSNPCQNGATCSNKINYYTCTCVPGYSGYNCQTNINECASNPCTNGGTCVDQINRYSCTCVPGYTGLRCGNDINECASNPCLNGGTCYNHLNRYSCTCSLHYGGRRCQQTSIARGRPATQSSNWDSITSAGRAVNGLTGTNYNAGYCTHTASQYHAWWRVDLGAAYSIGTVKILNRGDCCNERLANYYVLVGNEYNNLASAAQCYYFSGYSGLGAISTFTCTSVVIGRYLFIMLSGTNHLTICQIWVFRRD